LNNVQPTGYLHRRYAQSLAEIGAPVELPLSQGWLLQRSIAGTAYHDAMGCYPLFACQDWQRLEPDLEALGSQLVSVTLVADPFGSYNAELLQRCFPDLLRTFKDHFIVDLSRRPADFVAENHRRNARKALSLVDVQRCAVPAERLDPWVALYDNLIQVRHIRGLRGFSRQSFAVQLEVPGIVAWEARHEGDPVGMILWYVQSDIAYYHLAAYSQAGYDLRASFALFWRSLEYFAAAGLRWLNLGAGAGLQSSDDGLTRFKRGWATGTRPAYLCGRILDPPAYDELARIRLMTPTTYFPAYRLGEFD
jgi:hypothetical protein